MPTISSRYRFAIGVADVKTVIPWPSEPFIDEWSTVFQPRYGRFLFTSYHVNRRHPVMCPDDWFVEVHVG